MRRFLVTVEIVNRYWSIDVYEEAATEEDAVKSVQARFDEAVNLGYITGQFRATMAVEP